MKMQDIQQAITELSPAELALFREWFERFQREERDRQLRKLQGSLKGKGLLEAFMAEKKLERELDE